MALLTFKGFKHSEEAKLKMSLAKKGKSRSAEYRRKISESLKGHPSPMKGKKLSIETKLKIKEARKRQVFSMETRQKMSNAHKGAKCYMWKGGIAKENKSERQLIMEGFEYRAWRKAVFERDRFTCVLCGYKKGHKIEADHIKKWIDYPELRLEISNGRTLCHDCHVKTDTYGDRKSKEF